MTGLGKTRLRISHIVRFYLWVSLDQGKKGNHFISKHIWTISILVLQFWSPGFPQNEFRYKVMTLSKLRDCLQSYRNMLRPNWFDLGYRSLIPGIWGYSKHSETTLWHALITQFDAKALSHIFEFRSPCMIPVLILSAINSIWLILSWPKELLSVTKPGMHCT